MAKALFDRWAAAVALMLLGPLMVGIAVAIKLDSPGPVLFRQRRIGLRGRPFTLLKFRSMVPGADQRAANVSPINDPRVTKLGAVLRRWYLDELPQLVNVLKGEMSLVGPRPETPEFVARYSEEELQVLSVRPGVVGPSTLAFMDEAAILATVGDAESYYLGTMLHDRVHLDLEYVRGASFWYDIRLLIRQVFAIAAQAKPAVWVPSAIVLAALTFSLGPDILAGVGNSALGALSHAAAYAVLAASLLVFHGNGRAAGPRAVRVLMIIVGVIAFGGIVEIAQVVVHRDAQFADLAADAAGAVVTLIAWLAAQSHAYRAHRRRYHPIEASPTSPNA
jgi:lipopolysaccharide/colanic/teichoic acid biosynthesis glycosyltransferase